MERGRTKTSYSIPSLEAGEFAREHGRALEFHWKMFEAYFANLEDIADHDVIVRAGEAAGLPGDELRKALEEGTYRQQVLDGIEWSRAIGVTGVPTFIFEEQWAIVGAQDYNVFQSIMSKLGQEPPTNGHE